MTGEIAETLRVPWGGDSTKANLVVETLVFDEGQITCPLNGNVPTWGGNATRCQGTPEGQS